MFLMPWRPQEACAGPLEEKELHQESSRRTAASGSDAPQQTCQQPADTDAQPLAPAVRPYMSPKMHSS